MATEAPKSPVIKIFLVLCVLGFFASSAGAAYLYFRWDNHFPPLAELQEQVRLARATSEAAEAAQEDLEKTGIIDWTEDLKDQYSGHAENIANRMERDLEEAVEREAAKLSQEAAQAEAEAKAKAKAADDKLRRDIAAIQGALAEHRGSNGNPTQTIPPPPAPDTGEETPELENGGSIKKMEDDWLPPGVTRTE